jgi:hypothetical protein
LLAGRLENAGKRTGKGRESGVVKRILVALAALAVLVPISIAQAEPVQEFSFQLRDVKRDGRFTVIFTSRTYDTTGGVPPVLKQNFIRIPVGAIFRKQFLNRKYYCDGSKLLDSLRLNPEPNVKFYRRMENLKALARKLRRFPSERKNVRNIETCIKSKVAQGNVQVDARPFINELIPARIYLFFGKGTAPGAKASFQIIGVPDEDAAVVRNIPVVRDTRVALAANWFDEPTEGKYGYKLVLPVGPIQGVNISVAEVKVTTKGLTIKKKKSTCQRRRGGRCVKRKVKRSNIFWFTEPKCPSSGKLSFLAFYGYDDPQPDITKTVELPCPKFR